jgi:protein-S-isoprenylcysteine O-methyltransferase Ste14
MNTYQVALYAFVGLLLTESVAEYAAMRRTETLNRKHKREWTFYLVAIPFKAMVAAAMIEHISLRTAPSPNTILAGSLLVAVAIVIRVRGHFELDGAFSKYVEKSDNQKIIQSGLYARIRHPMYLGSILLFVGLPMVLASKSAWIFSVLGLIGLLIRIRKEESFLTEHFPGYREYMERTWRLIPYLF